MNCKKCGNLLDENAKFCNACGEAATIESNVGSVSVQNPVNNQVVEPQPVVQQVSQPVQQSVMPQENVGQAVVTTQQTGSTLTTQPKKKSNVGFIVIIIVLVAVIGILAIVALSGSIKFNFKVTNNMTTTTTTTTSTTITTTTTSPIASSETINYSGLTFSIPTGFTAQINESRLYFVNKNLRAAIETHVISGSASDFAVSAETIKTSFETTGYTNVSYTISSYSDVDYLLYKFTYNNQNYECIFTDTKKGFVLQNFLYYVDTVGETRYFDYVTEVTKSVKTSTSNFASGIPNLEDSYAPKINDVNFE